jgi:mono/diheme cytochrome c family protein
MMPATHRKPGIFCSGRGHTPAPLMSASRNRLIVSALACVFLLCAIPAAAQATEARIWAGIFTNEQAERGRANFNIACVRCHGADLAGQTAPSLKGPRFIGAWENENLYKLFTKIRDTMPPNFGTILPDNDKLDVLAYVLRTNEFPAGSQELKVDADSLEGIQIVRKGAALVITNFSVVRVVGCLAAGPDNSWSLRSAMDPVLSRDQPSTPEELKRADVQPLGTQAFRLVSVNGFKPDQLSGRKVEAKGLLYKDEKDARINVTSLQAVGACIAK